ncbi:radical SAM protein [Pseudoflavonifractor phocaeensis]|uniref:4Fe-4S cluster-binding domain-containing protein n=1 Tax=Pseudoflavonifractor phocaeensis TaxID=1870988 RepID=UPI001956F5A3|nr:radical SAM protein [Pseudoflavonifractor phocaeensis]MBM6938974.1 radical SAM protein [Pseudoflavonifractor phocaeensis]
MRCSLCPRRCNALRTERAAEGRCAMPSLPVVARAALHFWEEPPISGKRGSGTVFFSGCPLGCVFCQNEVISHENFGKAISVESLRAIFADLKAQGAHNINLVNPTHFAHAIRRALDVPPGIPVVWNTGGYERLETLGAMEGRVDIYLPDLKYTRTETAARCSDAPDYPETAKAAIAEMVRQVGACAFDEEGMLRRGVIIRHLILPGRLAEAKEVMDWVAETFPPGMVLFSLMSQYTPWGKAKELPGLNRRLRPSEIRAAQDYMAQLGLEGFTQDDAAAKSEYIPNFDLTGVEQ